MKVSAPGEEVIVALRFEYEGVEAVFVEEGSGEETLLLGDAKKEASEGRAICYAARLGAKIDPGATPGEYRCVRLTARDRLDDDWELAGKLDLVVRVERSPRRLQATTSEFL